MGALLLAESSVLAPAPSVAWWGLVPLIVLVAGAVILLTITSLAKNLPKWFPAAYTAGIGIATFATVIPPWTRVHHHGAISTLSGMYGVDGFSLFITAVLACSVVLAALLGVGYLEREGIRGIEFYVLLMLSASGGVVIAGANDLIILFLGIETLSIAVYVLAAMNLRRAQSQEAGIKYFVLGAFSSAFLLYGIALIYGATGSTNLAVIKTFLATSVVTDETMLFIGFALVLVGLAFKVAAAPFHSWTPDVYQGSPSPVVAYMASGVKAAGFAGMIRVFVVAFGQYADTWKPAVYALAVLTLLVGAILAVRQTDVKRMLAYSSISHAGFLLVAVEAATPKGVSAAVFYLGAYTFMVAGSFAVVTVVGNGLHGWHDLSGYKGLSKERPVLAFAFTIFLLAQAGVPFTTGFFAKFSVISASVDASSYWLAIVAMVCSVIGAFMYLRIVLTMYLGDPHGHEVGAVAVASKRPVPFGATIVIGVCVLVTLGFGIVPGVIDNLARDAKPVLVSAPPSQVVG
jgi:NADH-quinone oxidoreductase subunit N